MRNVMDIDGHRAALAFDPDIGMFRGEFVGLSGGADFYAASVEELRTEGSKSLRIFFELCREKGIEPRRPFSGRFNLRLDPAQHEAAAIAAAAESKSLNEWVAGVIEEATA